MAEEATEKLLLDHLRDVHAIEEQALKQLERACKLARDDEAKGIYRDHLGESEEHERLIRERLEAYELKPSAVKDLTMRSGAIGIRQLADIAPDTPVKLAMHFYAFEHLEIAAYEVLKRLASEAGDDETAEVARCILEQECAAAERIAGTFDSSVEQLLTLASEQQSQSKRAEDAKDAEMTSEDSEKTSETAEATA